MSRKKTAESYAAGKDTGPPARWAWLPIPLFLIAIALLWAMGPETSHENIDLAIALNLAFSVLASFIVAYLIGRSYLAGGAPGLLMLGCGVVVWGLAGVMGLLGNLLGAPPVMIHNSCVLISAACQLVGALLLFRPKPPVRAPVLRLASAYALSLVAVLLVTLSALKGWIPPFFTQGQGGTPLRQVVLGSSIAMFLLTADLLRTARRVSPSQFTHWYSLALGLIAAGLLGVMIQSSSGSLLGWTGRAAQFLSGAYMVVAAVASARESGSWSISLEEALRESEEKYHVLFRNMAEGFALYELLYDGQGLPVDWSVLEVNDAYSRSTGILPERIVGRRISEVFPDAVAEYLPHFAAVVATQTPVDFETYAKVTGRYNHVVTFPAGGHRFASIVDDITERKRTEEALRESEERFRAVFEQSGVGIAATDRSGRLLSVNPAFEEMIGYGIDELTSMTVADITHPDDWPSEVHYIDEALAGDRERNQLEKRYIRKNGEVIWVRINVTVMPDCGEQGVFAIAVVEDITERKQAEEAMRRSEERLLRIGRASRIGLYEWNAGQDRAFWSPEHYELFGLEQDSPAGYEHWIACVHPDDRERVTRGLAEILELSRNGQSRAFQRTEYRVVHGDGSVLWLDASTESDTQGGDLILRGAVRDITDRKQTEAALRASREDLNRAQEVGKIGSWRLDVRSNALTWSDQSHRIFGVPQGIPLTYETFLGLVHPDDREYVHTRWNASLRGEPYDIEHRIVVGEQVKWVREKAYLEFDSAGELLGGHGITEDITERKESEQALTEAKDLLEHQVRLLQQALTPARPRIADGYSVASAYIPAYAGTEIGGDFLDVFRTEDGKVGILIGDVSGKGIEAAALAATTRSTVRAFAYRSSSPADALSDANSLLSANRTDPVQFVTSFLAVIDPATGDISYSSAGHPPAVVSRRNGETMLLRTPCMPLGVIEAADYEDGRCSLGAGDSLVLYTDGITEARAGSGFFDTEGIECVLKACDQADPDELVERILDAARDHGDGRFRDDTAVLIVRREM